MNKTSFLCGLPIVLSSLFLGLELQASGISEIAGIYKIPLTSAGGGANFVSAPMQPKPVFRGKVSAISGNTITLEGSPRLTSGAYSQAAVGSFNFAQYLVLLRKDASSTPGNAGDWFGIVRNTENQLTLTPGLALPSTSFGVGDEIEIRKMTSIKDLFGSGATCILNKDVDTDITQSQEDIIRLTAGTGFAEQIIYHNGAVVDEGYYVEDSHDPDGSKITLAPDEVLWVFRKTGSATVNVVSTGRAQSTPLTHYLAAGANPLATGFAVESPVGTSSLLEAGWVSDVNEDLVIGQDGIIRSLQGTGFVDTVFHYAGVNADPGWYLNDALNPTYPLPAGQGLMYFAVNSLIWRQPAPFKP